MFAVYGMTGRLFRGTLEQLRQVGGVGALARIRSSAAVQRDGRDAAAESAGAFVEALQQTSGRAATVDEGGRGALAAYVQTQAQPAPRRPLHQVQDVMSRTLISLAQDATVLQAWQLLSDKNVGQAPVLDAQGHLIGLVTRADLLAPQRLPTPDRHALVWRALMQQNVTQIMWTPVPSVSPDSDLRRVAQVLLDTGLPGLAVVDEQGAVVGFVARSDILRAVVTDPPLDLWG